MSAFHQMGNDTKNLIEESALKGFKGAVLSPVNEEQVDIAAQIKKYGSKSFRMIFDPQLYYPRSDRGSLPKWSYFPSDVDTADLSSSKWWKGVVSKLGETVGAVGASGVCSPAVVPKSFTNEYYKLVTAVSKDMVVALGDQKKAVLTTVLARLADLADPRRVAEIASLLSKPHVNEVFLAFVSDVVPRREFTEPDELAGAIRLIRKLEASDVRVTVGFSSSDIVLWKFAGATNCASGKFFNLRRFTSSRFDPPAAGGGQLPYWFEEGLFAYLRESDVLRVQSAGGLSGASQANPFGKVILDKLSKKSKQKWIADSWRQYMYWFSDIERRLASGADDGDTLLKRAESGWDAMEKAKVLMEERPNKGDWLRPWRRAVLEA